MFANMGTDWRLAGHNDPPQINPAAAPCARRDGRHQQRRIAAQEFFSPAIFETALEAFELIRRVHFSDAQKGRIH